MKKTLGYILIVISFAVFIAYLISYIDNYGKEELIEDSEYIDVIDDYYDDDYYDDDYYDDEYYDDDNRYYYGDYTIKEYPFETSCIPLNTTKFFITFNDQDTGMPVYLNVDTFKDKYSTTVYTDIISDTSNYSSKYLIDYKVDLYDDSYKIIDSYNTLDQFQVNDNISSIFYKQSAYCYVIGIERIEEIYE